MGERADPLLLSSPGCGRAFQKKTSGLRTEQRLENKTTPSERGLSIFAPNTAIKQEDARLPTTNGEEKFASNGPLFRKSRQVPGMEGREVLKYDSASQLQKINKYRW